MEVSYRREMNHNYMIIEPDRQNAWGYESKMLVTNCIEGLLKFRIRQSDDRQLFYYEISSKQPLSRLLQNRYITAMEIRQLLIHIALTLNRVEEYLLREDQILLDPAYIYMEPDDFSVHLCIVPGYTGCFPEAFTKLLQFILEKVDHKDRDSVVLAYSLYHESLKENYGMGDLLRFLTENEKKNEGDRSPGEDSLYPGFASFEDCDCETWRENGKGDIESEDDSLTAWKDIDSMNHEREKGTARGGFKRFLSCLGIMASLPLLLWLLRGKAVLYKYSVHLTAAEVAVFLSYVAFEVVRRLPIKDVHHGKPGAGENGGLRYSRGNGEQREDRRQAVSGERDKGKTREKGKGWGVDRGQESSRSREKNRGHRRDGTVEGRNFSDNKWKMNLEFEDDGDVSGGRETQDSVTSEKGTNIVGVAACAADENRQTTTLLADFTDAAGGAGSAAVRLERVDGEGEDITVPYFPFIIGKSENLADYQLNRNTVSRLHIRIDEKDGKFYITDLNSTNGTAVRDRRLEANETVEVENGDRIDIADVRYQFVKSRP